jgi:hypothetical protein
MHEQHSNNKISPSRSQPKALNTPWNHLVSQGPVRHGYPWVPTDQAHSYPRKVGPTYQKTRRPVSKPVRLDMWAQRRENSLGCTRQGSPDGLRQLG